MPPKNLRTIFFLLSLVVVVSATHRSYAIDDFVDSEIANDDLNLRATSDNNDRDFGIDDSELPYERQRTR